MATSVEIPLLGSDTEVIDIAFDELPDDVDEVMHLLRAEEAQMHLWVTIAIEYYRRDKPENFVKVGEPYFVNQNMLPEILKNRPQSNDLQQFT